MADINNSKLQKLTSRPEQAWLNEFIDDLSPEEIRQKIISLLEPFLTSTEYAKEIAINFCVPLGVVLQQMHKTPLMIDNLTLTLEVLNAAKKKDSSKAIQAYVDWQADFSEALSLYWSQVSLEVDTSKMEDDEFLLQTTREIGLFIEGLLNSYLRCLLQTTSIGSGKELTREEISSLDLGKVIELLLTIKPFGNMLTIRRLKLNQWRNISYHHKYSIEEGKIICELRGRAKKVVLTRPELESVLMETSDVFKVIKTAHDIYVIDNAKAISKATAVFNRKPRLKRPEGILVGLHAGLATQGFSLVEFTKSDDEAKMVVKDLAGNGELIRLVHSSQFVGTLYSFLKKIDQESINYVVEYQTGEGKPKLRSSITKSEIVEIEQKGLPFSEIAHKVKMVDMDTGYEIP